MLAGLNRIYNKDSKTKKYKVIVGSKKKEYTEFLGAYLLKPNLMELSKIRGICEIDSKKALAISKNIFKTIDLEFLVITMGEKDILLVGKDGQYKYYTGEHKKVVDVTGAGDSVLATIAVCLSSKIHINEAILIANNYAQMSVMKHGTKVVSLGEFLYKQKKNSKILTQQDCSVIMKYYKRENFKIVFANWCFDIFHSGHTNLLNEAKKLGDILIVGVNSDDSIKRIKGEKSLSVASK